MSLLTVSELRMRVTSPLSDGELHVIIDDIESDLAGRFGPLPTTPPVEITETVAGHRAFVLFLKRRILEIESITVDGTALAPAQYRVWPGNGMIERTDGGTFGIATTVVYKPGDNVALWKSAIIDLVRLHLERTAMKSESVAGEYSYTAPDNWDVEAARIYRKLRLAEA